MLQERINKKALVDFISGPVLLHFTLPFVMIYLCAGTIAQKYVGLYEATHIFFSSLIVWLGFLPLPGFPVVLAVMFINLAGKLIFKSPWTLRNSGIIITHIAVMMLLLGGLITALFSREGFVDLMQGDNKAYVTDYHVREFVIRDENGVSLAQYNPNDFKVGQSVSDPELPFIIRIKEACRHCKIEKRAIGPNDDGIYNGMAQFMRLTDAPLQRENESNMGGVVFALYDRQGHEQGVYASLEDVPNWPQVDIGQSSYRFIYQKQKRALPFEIELLDFTRTTHPGTQLAKSYQSKVRIKDENGAWESLVKMNEPLRYKGYTLFQSSFMRTDTGDVSVLAVVWNAGRSFPYIAGLVLSLGLIVHLVVRRRPAK